MGSTQALGASRQTRAEEIEFALLAPVSPTLEGALLGLLGDEAGLTGYMAVGVEAGKAGFLLMVQADADRGMLVERLCALGVPEAQVRGRVLPPAPETALVVDNLQMLIGLMNGERGARQIAPDRRALRRAA